MRLPHKVTEVVGGDGGDQLTLPAAARPGKDVSEICVCPLTTPKQTHPCIGERAKS